MAITVQKYQSGFLLSATRAVDVHRQLFRCDWLREQGKLLSTAVGGRARVCVFRHAGDECVLRHYRRGGMVAKFASQSYFWMGLRQTRAWRELALLDDLHAEGLPVPRPLAAWVRRRGVGYRAALITYRIPNSQTFADLLQQRAAPETLWRAVGETLRRFHDAGVYHADLNANNLLIDDQSQVFLIDFDKGERLGQGARWQRDNLSRLHRSLCKLQRRHATFYFSDAAWGWLTQAYAQSGERIVESD